jgi:molybdopterin molybdotransferase
MSEFLTLLPPPEALQKLLDHLPIRVRCETVETVQGLGRVTAQAIVAPQPLPSFPRSTVDGYAVRAADTHGAGESLPAYLRLCGEVPMGAAPTSDIPPGQTMLIHTGGMLPPSADAVVMLEHTQGVRADEIEVLRAVAAGENAIAVGEDVREGEEVIPSGTRLRPAEIGGLVALGLARLEVACAPRVGILSTGDEVVPPDARLRPGQVRDVNSYSLSALVDQAGGAPVRYGILPDRADLLRPAAERALSECDLIVITAGSSASTRDLTAQIVDELGKPGVLVHGVNVRPGKPTILGVCEGKAVVGLPGNPVSALVIAGLFVVPVVERLLGLRRDRLQGMVTASLTINVASQAGREDWIPVRLLPGPDGYQAEPLFGKSNLIFTLSRADGLVRVPPDATGLHAGDRVAVTL